MVEQRLTIINIIQIILENIIYIMSRSYIYLNYLYLECEKFYYYYLPKYTIIWMKNNDNIYTIKFNTINTSNITKSLKINKPDYHIILYKPESLYYIYIIEHLFPHNLPLDSNIIPCNFHFISVVVKSNTKETNITSFLFNRTNNHYISNTILFDKSFNNYISTKLLSTTESDINEIHIIDNMANNFVLNTDQHIFLYSDSYTIINKSK